MFLQECVCPQGGGVCASVHAGIHPPDQALPRADPPRPDTPPLRPDTPREQTPPGKQTAAYG